MIRIILFSIFSVIVFSCSNELNKPPLIPKWNIYKIENEHWNDTNKNLISIIYQMPRNLIPVCKDDVFSYRSNKRNRRVNFMELTEGQRSYALCYSSLDEDFQIILTMKPHRAEYKLDSTKSYFVKYFKDLNIGGEYYNNKLLSYDTINGNFLVNSNEKVYSGFAISSCWESDSAKIYNSGVWIDCEGYLFYSTINLRNSNAQYQKDVIKNFIESLWIKIDKDGRGYGK